MFITDIFLGIAHRIFEGEIPEIYKRKTCLVYLKVEVYLIRGRITLIQLKNQSSYNYTIIYKECPKTTTTKTTKSTK